VRSVCAALDEEAIRVVKGMPKWKAGENNGQKCRSFFQLPVTFTLQ
jgi:protein TonB